MASIGTFGVVWCSGATHVIGVTIRASDLREPDGVGLIGGLTVVVADTASDLAAAR